MARWLLITIGVLALLGTLIPQQEEPAAYLARFGPTGAQWLARLGLTDLYHSWYFSSLFALLILSLIVSSVSRWAVNLKALGSIATHLGFALIIVGGIIRNVAGFEGVVELREGEQTQQLKITETQTQPLPFIIHLDDFYFAKDAENPGTIPDFVSHVHLIQAGVKTAAVIRVNHPVIYQGFRIYQLGYDPDNPTWTALLFVKDPGIPE